MSKKKRLTFLSTIIALSLSGTVMASDINYDGDRYIINNADGADTVTITTDSTATGAYGVFANSGEVTVKELTIDSKIGGIQLLKENTPTKLTLNADNMTFKNDKWSAFYTTTWQSRNEAAAGSSITVNVKDTLKADVSDFIGTGADKSLSITAKKIDVNSDSTSIWGCGTVNIEADDIMLKSGKATNIWAENRDSEYTNANKKVGTADYTIVGKDKLVVSSEGAAIRADKGKVALWSDKLIRIKGDILVNGSDARVMIGRGITAFKSRSTAPDIEIVGDIEATTGELDLALETANSFIIGNINTGTNQDAVISLSNGATWQAGNGSSEVSQIAGNHGVVAVNLNSTNTSVTIHDNQNDDLVIKATELDLTGGTRYALTNLEQKLAKVVKTSGKQVTYAAASVNTNLIGEVELKNNRVITTMDTDDLVISGDVKVGNASMADTVKQVNTNKNDIGQNKTDIGNLTTKVNDNKGAISNLDTKVDTKVNELTGKIDANTSAIDQNKTAISNLDTKVDTKVNEFTGKIDANTSAIDQNKTAISNLDTKVDTKVNELTGKIDANTSAIDQNKTAISNLDTKVDTKVNELTGKIDSNTSAIDQNKTAISNLDTKVNSNVSDLTGKIDANTVDIEKNTTDISKNTADIAKNAADIAKIQVDTEQINTNKDNISQNAQNIAEVNSNLVTAVDTINKNVADGFDTINKNVYDGFNTINGAIDGETTNRIAADNMLSSRIDSLGGRVDKVGAGAAALAALHPLDYDVDNKLSFASGVGNYAGSTAMAIGAFYRPNENCMMSLGGSMGNGENMVNLGVSFAIGKGQSPYASLSKKDLVHKVDQMSAEIEQLKAQNKDNEAMKAEIEQLKAIVAELTKKQ